MHNKSQEAFAIQIDVEPNAVWSDRVDGSPNFTSDYRKSSDCESSINDDRWKASINEIEEWWSITTYNYEDYDSEWFEIFSRVKMLEFESRSESFP